MYIPPYGFWKVALAGLSILVDAAVKRNQFCSLTATIGSDNGQTFLTLVNCISTTRGLPQHAAFLRCFSAHSLETLEQLLWLCAASDGTQVKEHGIIQEKNTGRCAEAFGTPQTSVNHLKMVFRRHWPQQVETSGRERERFSGYSS